MIFYPPLLLRLWGLCLQGRVCGVCRMLSPVTPYWVALLCSPLPGCLVAALLFTLLLAASRPHTQRTGRLHRQQQEQARHHND